MKFENKVVIVTGGASGIGLVTARAFASEGAKIVIVDFSPRGQDVVDQLQKNATQALFVQTDVSNEKSVEEMVQKVAEHFGQIDVLFANAGIAKDAPATELSLPDWQATIDINLTGVFLSDRAVLQYWMKNKQRGVIVNCGSIHGFVGKGGVTAYAAAKGGVKLLTQSLAIDYAPHGIRVNAVCPGYIDTPLLNHIDQEGINHLSAMHPMGRLGKPQEVASVVLFLASEDASFMTGTSLLVDGGYTAQ